MRNLLLRDLPHRLTQKGWEGRFGVSIGPGSPCSDWGHLHKQKAAGSLWKAQGLELESVCWLPGSGFNITLLNCVRRSISKSNSGGWGLGGSYLFPPFFCCIKVIGVSCQAFLSASHLSGPLWLRTLLRWFWDVSEQAVLARPSAPHIHETPEALVLLLGESTQSAVCPVRHPHTLSEHLVLLKYTNFSSFKDSSI